MKLACTSGALHRQIESGELTQLEFLDLCARDLACDGIVLDVRHFPRTDDDYLAQIKKTLTDRGLSMAALSDSNFFTSSREHMSAVLAWAVALGAPLLAAPLGLEIALPWNDQLERIGTATSLAKALNVTVAVRNAPHTFAATTQDCKRVAKEGDSAWLRYGPEPQLLDAASDPQVLQANTVLLWSDARMQTDRSIAQTAETFSEFRGHLVIDEAGGGASVTSLASSLRAWRVALTRG